MSMQWTDAQVASRVPLSQSSVDDDSRYWHDAVATASFRTLLATKRRCVAPLLIASFVFIIAMTLLAGFAKPFMGIKVVGSFNVAYLLVVLTYGLCWTVAVLYVRTANRDFDAQAAAAIAALETRGRP
jgi:uncharacterized membrane protein (DUF485 family)